MQHPSDATSMTQWLNGLIAKAREGRIHSTSAGAGPGRDYAYLHYSTEDGEHAVLVFRPTSRDDGAPDVLAYRCEARANQDVARMVEALTHQGHPG